MVDIYGQFDGKNSIFFMPSEAEELCEEYKKNQGIRVKTTKASKDIGKVVEQNNLLHACIKLVTDNRDEPQFMTTESTKMSCKIGIDFRDPRFCFVRPDGGVQLAYRSFRMTGPDPLKGKKRDEVIQKAFEWLASAIGVTVEEMVEEAKSKMQRRYIQEDKG